MNRHERGLAAMREIGGTGYLDNLNSIRDIAPDLVEFAIDFAYGDVMSRAGLDLKTRQLCNVAALAVMPHAVPQLTWHVKGALNVGWHPAEILDAVMLSAITSGSAAIGSSLSVVRQVFEARQLGADALAAIEDVDARWCEAPLVIPSLELDDRTKALIAVAALTALGNAREQLKARILAALGAGASCEHVIEVIQQMVVYAGFPAALNGLAVARDAFAS